MPSCHETCCDKRRVPQRRKRSPSSYTIHRNVRVVVVPPPLAKSPGLFCVDGWSPSQKRALLSTYSSRNRKPSPPNSPWIRRPRRRRPAAKNKAFYPGASASATSKRRDACAAQLAAGNNRKLPKAKRLGGTSWLIWTHETLLLDRKSSESFVASWPRRSKVFVQGICQGLVAEKRGVLHSGRQQYHSVSPSWLSGEIRH